MDDFLEKLLEESLNGRVVPRFELPTDAQINATHAQLARLTREQRSFRMVPIETERTEADERE